MARSRATTQTLAKAAEFLRQLDLGTDESTMSKRQEALSVLDSYLVPRAIDPSAPVNVVFAGPTGSGKSTLLNSVMGRSLSPTGFLRPTTDEPLVCLGSGNEVTISLTDSEVVRGEAPILQWATLVDTPDIDSTQEDNRRLAFEALAGADVVVLVTSVSRYADLEPWNLLRAVGGRNVPVIHVINRVTTESAGAVTDYRRRLRSEGVAGPLIRVNEHQTVGADMLASAPVRNLRRAIMQEVGAIDSSALFYSNLGHVIGLVDDLRDRIEHQGESFGAVLGKIRTDSRGGRIADIALRWRSELAHARGPIWIGTRRSEAMVRLATRFRNELTLELGALVAGNLVGFRNVPSQLISTTVENRVTDWFDDVTPGDLERVRPRSVALKLEEIIRRVELEETWDSLIHGVLADIDNLVRGELALIDPTAFEAVLSDLRAILPLPAVVNG